MKLNLRSLIIGIGCFSSAITVSSQITENFDDITTLAGSGWVMQNNSTPIGTQANWFQGNAAVFNAFNGATTAYIAANYNFVAGANTIGGWLIAPNVTLRNGDVFTFYTRKSTPDTYPDRLEVRMSTNGASTNTGGGAATVGDFTTLLLSINPSLVTGVYPTAWTQYTITISGLPAPTSGRIAFRYFVTNGGPSGANSDYIGIDAFQYTPYVCPTLTISPPSLPGGTAGTAYNQSLSQSGALGAPGYAVIAGALPPGLTLSTAGVISGTPTATGTFNFTVGVADASGCSGSQAYSITIVCPVGGASLSAFPALCDNGALYTLVEGSPAGGTYSGTGVVGGMFDPAVGSQTITYTVIDAYGCPQVANGPLTVNTAPTVTLSTFADVCDNAGMVTLGGGSPSGGVFTGIGVSGGQFDPTSGSQPITYTYTDGNGCSNSDSQTQTVHTSPTVTLTPFTATCDNAGLITLSGGSPAGGTYTGTGVSAGQFDPTSGTQTLTYTFTDGNGCSNAASEIQTVNAAPTVTLAPFTTVCSTSGMVTLGGGSPAGGVYSGVGVSANEFNPAVGTQTITYTFTDGNGCSNAASEIHNVDPQPTVGISPASSNPCVTHAAFALNGTPVGGTYTGAGVTGTNFDPAMAGVGPHIINYIFTDGTTGCSDTATTTITVSGCAGIEDNGINAMISLYPNPASEVISVSFTDGLTAGNWKMEIYTIEGKLMYTKEILVNAGHIETIGLDSYHAGTYLMLLTNHTNKVAKRFVKE